MLYDKFPEKISLSEVKEPLELDDKPEIDEELEYVPLRKDFTLPRKIKITKLIITLVINFLIGGLSFSMAIVWFVNPPEVTTFYRVFAIFLLIFGGVLLGVTMVVLIIAILTVSYNSYKAATANPAQSLRVQ